MSIRKVDANQGEVVKAFTREGWSVLILSDVGKGCPDIAVGYMGVNFFIEIKDGHKPPSAQNLTEAQTKFFKNWKGQVRIINSIEGAYDFIRTICDKVKYYD